MEVQPWIFINLPLNLLFPRSGGVEKAAGKGIIASESIIIPYRYTGRSVINWLRPV